MQIALGPGKRAVAYIRVSTLGQATEGVSLDAQRSRIDAWCHHAGCRLDDGDVHVDAGLSGKRADNRPALNAALDAVCAAGGILVVYSLSRLARSVRDTLMIADRLQASGADLVSLSESIDTTSATGKMVFRLLAVLAEFERDLLSERTRCGLAHKRAKCERIGQVPWGFTLDPDGRTLVANEEERALTALMRQWQAAGWSHRKIARELDRLGVPTKRGGPSWRHATVGSILRREIA